MAMEIIVIRWYVEISNTEDRLEPDPPEVKVLQGDTIAFTGASASVTFPPGITEPESRPAPGAFRVKLSASDGLYAYRIDSSSEDRGGAVARVKIGPAS